MLPTHLEATSLTTENKTGGVSSTVIEPPAVPIVNATKPPVSWLAVHLLESRLDEVLVKDCESKLIVREGIVSGADFAELKIDEDYLEKIGISARGAQLQIMRLHKKLHAQYTPSSSPPTQQPPVITTPRRSPTGNVIEQHMQNNLIIVSHCFLFSRTNIYLWKHLNKYASRLRFTPRFYF